MRLYRCRLDMRACHPAPAFAATELLSAGVSTPRPDLSGHGDIWSNLPGLQVQRSTMNGVADAAQTALPLDDHPMERSRISLLGSRSTRTITWNLGGTRAPRLSHVLRDRFRAHIVRVPRSSAGVAPRRVPDQFQDPPDDIEPAHLGIPLGVGPLPCALLRPPHRVETPSPESSFRRRSRSTGRRCIRVEMIRLAVASKADTLLPVPLLRTLLRAPSRSLDVGRSSWSSHT